MKYIKYFYAFILMLSLNNASAQSETVKILLLNNENQVKTYYRSIMNLFPENKHIEIEELLNQNGDKILKLSLPSWRDGRADFISTFSTFIRTNDGEEICTSQLFAFNNDSDATKCLNFVKDNFNNQGNNKWVAEMNDKFTVKAEFEKRDNNFSTIKFSLVPTKK